VQVYTHVYIGPISETDIYIQCTDIEPILARCGNVCWEPPAQAPPRPNFSIVITGLLWKLGKLNTYLCIHVAIHIHDSLTCLLYRFGLGFVFASTHFATWVFLFAGVLNTLSRVLVEMSSYARILCSCAIVVDLWLRSRIWHDYKFSLVGANGPVGFRFP